MLLRRLVPFLNHSGWRLVSSASAVPLAYETIGDNSSQKTAVFLHGILGSKRNFRTPGKVFATRFKGFRCVTVDHRGHGDSGIASSHGPHTVNACVKDLKELFNGLFTSPPTVLIAHSFGGKVALSYALTADPADKLPDDIWILDCLPAKYSESEPDGEQSVTRVFNVLAMLPMTFASRDWMIQEIQSHGLAKGIALWLGTNIVNNEFKTNSADSCKWNFNMKVVQELFVDFCNLDLVRFSTNVFPLFFVEYFAFCTCSHTPACRPVPCVTHRLCRCLSSRGMVFDDRHPLKRMTILPMN